MIFIRYSHAVGAHKQTGFYVLTGFSEALEDASRDCIRMLGLPGGYYSMGLQAVDGAKGKTTTRVHLSSCCRTSLHSTNHESKEEWAAVQHISSSRTGACLICLC